MPSTSLQLEHLAMATRWRIVLRGGEAEQLTAVGNSCTLLIDDWDRLLSLYNPASEVSRINRAQPGTILKLQPDLAGLLQFCDGARQATLGLFEVALHTGQVPASKQAALPPYKLDLQQATFTWLVPHHRLDFGGIAKGYVLDQLMQFVREHHVAAALFDAGGSSLLAWDSDNEPAPWHVTLSAPGQGPRELVVGTTARAVDSHSTLQLQNRALAYSATRMPGTTSGQTIDPRDEQELPEQRACAVVADSAAWAEVLSTAALCMGEAAAAKYIREQRLFACRLGWIVGETVHWHDSNAPG
jgi:thiamine biosynthesis lipoprotein